MAAVQIKAADAPQKRTAHPAFLSAGFRPFFLFGAPLVGARGSRVALRLLRARRASERLAADGLARARDGLRVCVCNGGRIPPHRDPEPVVIYVLVTSAALFRLLSPLAGGQALPVTWIAGTAWSAAFAMFAILYGRFYSEIVKLLFCKSG